MFRLLSFLLVLGLCIAPLARAATLAVPPRVAGLSYMTGGDPGPPDGGTGGDISGDPTSDGGVGGDTAGGGDPG